MGAKGRRSDDPTRESVKTISRVASEYGVSLRTLRFYEQQGFLNPIREGNMRLYRSKDEERLVFVLKNKKFGLSLAEIARLCAGGGHEKDQRPDLFPYQIQRQRKILELEKTRVSEALKELDVMQTRMR